MFIWEHIFHFTQRRIALDYTNKQIGWDAYAYKWEYHVIVLFTLLCQKFHNPWDIIKNNSLYIF